MKSILKWLLRLYVRCDHHHDHASRASKFDVFRSRRMRAKLCQRGGVVRNLASLLGDPAELGLAELRANPGAPSGSRMDSAGR